MQPSQEIVVLPETTKQAVTPEAPENDGKILVLMQRQQTARGKGLESPGKQVNLRRQRMEWWSRQQKQSQQSTQPQTQNAKQTTTAAGSETWAYDYCLDYMTRFTSALQVTHNIYSGPARTTAFDRMPIMVANVAIEAHKSLAQAIAQAATAERLLTGLRKTWAARKKVEKADD